MLTRRTLHYTCAAAPRWMGNESSSEASSAAGAGERPQVGYHVLRVNPSSPGHLAGLIPFFDFIVSVGGDLQHQRLLEHEDSTLVDALQQNVGRELTLGVFSSRSETVRHVQLTPRNDWGGIGLLGVSIRFNSIKNAEEQVWHVEQVYPRSPAFTAGLQANTDYIVGTPDVLFSDEDDLYTMLRSSASVPLYVYSVLSDDIRIVTVAPNAEWGGDGVLGCELGYGLLHRIPRQRVKNSPAAVAAVPAAASGPAPSIVLPAPQIDLTPQQPPVSHIFVPHASPSKAVIHTAPAAAAPVPVPVSVPVTPVAAPAAAAAVPAHHHLTAIRVPSPAPSASLTDSGFEAAPQEVAPQPPVTPGKSATEHDASAAKSAPASAAPPSSSSKSSLEDHKKKLAALQAKMEGMKQANK